MFYSKKPFHSINNPLFGSTVPLNKKKKKRLKELLTSRYGSSDLTTAYEAILKLLVLTSPKTLFMMRV